MNPSIILAVVLSLIHYFSDIFGRFLAKFHSQTVSFSSGFFISYIFLELFPNLSEGMVYTDIFLLILFGFSIFHLAEKYVYQHDKDKQKLLKDLREIHMIGFFIDHFIIGFVLILALKLPDLASILVFIPLVLHTISSSLTMESLHKTSKTIFTKIILSLSTLVGAIVALFIVPLGAWYYGLFAFAMGALLYVTIRDILPQRDGGAPTYFLIGVLLNLALVFLTKVF